MTQRPPLRWRMPTSQRMVNPSIQGPQSTMLQNNNKTIQPTSRRKKRLQTSMPSKVVPERHSTVTATTATTAGTKTGAAAAIAAVSRLHFHQAQPDNMPVHPPAQPRSQIRPTTARLQQIHQKRGSIPTASYMQQTQIHKSATDLSALFMPEQLFATRDDATRMGKGETAGGDAVDRRRPPNQQ